MDTAGSSYSVEWLSKRELNPKDHVMIDDWPANQPGPAALSPSK